MLFLSYDVAKVSEALRQNVLACTKVVTDLQLVATIVILGLELIQNGRCTADYDVNAVSILRQGLSFLLVIDYFVVDLLQPVHLDLANTIVTIGPGNKVLLGIHHALHLLSFGRVFLSQCFWTEHH